MFDLNVKTPPEWAEIALSDFNAFLLDHAACERKASAVGLSFVVRYPDRREILDPMIHFAREELEHFHQVFRLVQKRGLVLAPDERDPYINYLMRAVRTGAETRFLDRLLVSSIIEARGFERLSLITEALKDSTLKPLYDRLTRAEAGHKNLFIKLARHYFSSLEIQRRLESLLEVEAKAIASVPFRSAVH